MLKFISFSSGSCGNCYLLLSTDEKGDSSGILIDAGISTRMLKKNLMSLGLSYDCFGSILVTHDHLDHIRSLASYCKYLRKPVYSTSRIQDALALHSFTSAWIGGYRKDLEEGKWNEIEGFKVRYFEVPHDATQTVGYAIEAGGHKFVIMTDIGKMVDEAVSFAKQADTVVVESNYDVDMLMSGPYTHELKMRICQGHGHLSNDQCAEAIKRFYHKGLKNLFLCHLSENNNEPEIAFKTAKNALFELGVEEGEVNLRTLARKVPSPMFEL